MKWKAISHRVFAFLILTVFILPLVAPREAGAAEVLRDIATEHAAGGW